MNEENFCKKLLVAPFLLEDYLLSKGYIKKVSKPIKQGFSMTPKDHALGKFSYAAIQAKKAGKKSFEYAGKTFPVKKGSMYGSSNKAIYKAKMPAIFKMGVKGLNKLDK